MYLKLARKINIKNARKLDLTYGGKVYHGHYRACRSVSDVKAYCAKVTHHAFSVITSERERITSTQISLGYNALRMDTHSVHFATQHNTDRLRRRCGIRIQGNGESDILDMSAKAEQDLDCYIHKYIV